MNITIAGQHMSVGASLEEYVREKLQHIYSETIREAQKTSNKM